MKKALLLTLLVAPGIAMAADNDHNKQGKKQDDRICRDIEETGSRLAHQQLCLTREHWRQYNQQTREALDRSQKTGGGPSGG